jgi:A/G-specific adenine glycosylase
MLAEETQALIAWYAQNSRDLPWRGTEDPYAVWVSEVMLQQTRVETVIPYYERWMENLPTLIALADTPRDAILSLWEGLGYYRRAHSLHRAAAQVVQEYGGNLPQHIDDLENLPGIGRYTAAAIAAIAFNHDVVAMDGNLRRVLSRLLNLMLDPRSPEGNRMLTEHAYQLLPKGQASAFNQALMDLGALICTPRSPKCAACPLASYCQAYRLGVQEERPLKSPRRAQPHYTVAAGVLRRNAKVLICRRPEGELLGGLWEFPGGKQEDGELLEDCLRRELREELGIDVAVGAPLGIYQHAYTHFKVTVHAFECRLVSGEPRTLVHPEMQWADLGGLALFPMGKIDRQIANTLTSGDVQPGG